jgi:magnesium transporter
MIMDYALYRNGERALDGSPISELIASARKDGGFLWVGVSEPTSEEFDGLVQDFHLHPLAVEDAITAKQRPKLETYDGMTFVVVRTTFYEESASQVTTGEILTFIGDHYIVVVRHGEGSPLTGVRSRLEQNPALLKLGPYAVLHAIVDRVIDSYIAIAAELEKDVIEVEQSVFSDRKAYNSEKIYFLKRELLEFSHAIHPLQVPLQRLAVDFNDIVPDELAPFFRDTLDHLHSAVDIADALDNLLTSALSADLAHVQVQQNEDMRKITSWVALASTPTMVAGIYGMNFDHMPELGWTFGYPLVVGVMVAVTSFLYYKFKKAHWL